MEEAIELARANNPTIKNARLEVSKIGDDVAATRSQQFPNVTLQASETYNLIDQEYEFEEGAFGQVNGTPVPDRNVDIETRSDFTTTFQAKITQPLSELYGLGLAIDKLETDQKTRAPGLARRTPERRHRGQASLLRCPANPKRPHGLRGFHRLL